MQLKKTILFSIGPIFSALIALITVPLIAYFFSAQDVGRLSILQAIISFSLMIGTLGLDQSYVREFHESEDKIRLFKSAVFPGLSVLIIIIFFLFLLPISISEILFDLKSELILLLLILCIFLSFFSRFLSLVVRMEERALAFSLNQIFTKLFFLIFIFSAIYLLETPMFFSILTAQVFSLLLVFVFNLWLTRKTWLYIFKTYIKKSELIEMLKFSIPLIGSSLAFWGITTMDRFFLKALSGFEELGIYSVAINFAGAALILQLIFSTIWVPTVYRWASSNIDESRIQKIVNYISFAIITIWAFIGMFSWILNYILPDLYSKVPIILIASVAYPLLYALSDACGIGVGIMRKTKYVLLGSLFALLINAVGNMILIPKLGSGGAALASALAFLCFFLVRTEYSARVWKRLSLGKTYVFVFLLIFLCFLVNLKELSIKEIFLIYLAVNLLSFFSYRRELSEPIMYFKEKYLK
jgi:O-antigen/teichoic acid export membrane protein